MKEKLKLPLLHRSFEFERAKMDDEKRTIELSFSSEIEADRWFGKEILDHTSASVRMGRLNNGGALLLNHDTDKQVGVVEKAEISPDRRGKALVRFGNSELAKEIWDDVKSGIRRLVSVGYRIHRMVREKVEDEVATYRATDWEPMEISIVPVPVDPTVGINRGANGETNEEFEIEIEDKTMRTRSLNLNATAVDGGGAATTTSRAEVTHESPLSGDQIRAEAQRLERERIATIGDIAASMTRHNSDIPMHAQRAIKEGMSVEQFRKQVMDLIAKGPIATAQENHPGALGMSEKEVKRFSIARAIKSVLETGRVQDFEREVSDQCSKQYGQSARSFWIPFDVLNSGFLAEDLKRALYQSPLMGQAQQRDLLVGTASLGGNLVATELHAERFIDLLRNRVLVAVMGATLLPGLQGTFVIPRQSGTTTAHWVTEAQATTESNLTIDQITLTPKGVTALQDYSKNLVLQSSLAVEALIRNDVTAMLARAIDLAALHGSGASGQPTGIISVSGIGDVAGGTNGAAPTWANIVTLETEVAQDNADVGAVGYLTNAKVRGKLKTTEKATSTGMFIWGDNLAQPGFGMLNGYRAGVSNQVASNLTKGTSTTVASAIFFGNWADLLLGQWGNGIDILIDPYTAAGNRLFKLYADAFVDVAVRHPESFSAMKDALTT